jgi:predicted class III extradiol MEMO1 family dioxygenase
MFLISKPTCCHAERAAVLTPCAGARSAPRTHCHHYNSIAAAGAKAFFIVR